jgi:CBS domain-containing protein
MKTASNATLTPSVVLWAETAADLMTPDLVSLSADETFKEAVAFLADNGFSAAPVIDKAGRPIGVLSQSDIVAHDRETVSYLEAHPADVERIDRSVRDVETVGRGFQVECVDRTTVRDVMTPAIFSVAPETPAAQVIDEMVLRQIHRLFVVDADGVLVGVITAGDVLRHLRPMT